MDLREGMEEMETGEYTADLMGGSWGELKGEGVHLGKMHPLSIFSLSEIIEVAAVISCTEADPNPIRNIRLG